MYDYIIAGTGVAGMSLLKELVYSPHKNSRILLLDAVDKSIDNQSIAYWDKCFDTNEQISTKSWNKVEVISDGFTKTHKLGRYKYKFIRTSDLYQHVLSLTEDLPNIDFKQEKVIKIIDEEDSATVHTSENKYKAKFVFNSIQNDVNKKVQKSVVKQYVNGIFIKTTLSPFSVDVIKWIDLRTPQDNSFRFIYFLPFSESEALVELISFSPCDSLKILNEYIQNQLKVNDYVITDREAGITLLTNKKFNRKSGNRIMLIGGAGGMVKHSTGYGYNNIYKDSVRIVNNLLVYENPLYKSRSPFIYKLGDDLLFKIYKNKPFLAKTIFEGMLEKNDVESIFDFLEEKANLLQIIKLIFTMRPFVLIKNYLGL